MAWRYRNQETRTKTEIEELFPEKPMVINPFKIYYNLIEGTYEALKGTIETIEDKCTKWGNEWRSSGKYAIISLPAGIAASNISDSHRWFRNSGWSTFAYTVGTIAGAVAGGMTAFSMGAPEAINAYFGFATQTPITGVGSFFSAMMESTGSMIAHAGSFIAGGAVGGPAGFLGTVATMFAASTAGATAFSLLKSVRNLPVAFQRWNYTRKKNAAEKAAQVTNASPAPAAPAPTSGTASPAAGSSFNQTATPVAGAQPLHHGTLPAAIKRNNP